MPPYRYAYPSRVAPEPRAAPARYPAGSRRPSEPAADRPFYSGKHRKHRMNLQVIAGPAGDIVGVSGPLPGALNDLTAARIWGIVAELAASGVVC